MISFHAWQTVVRPVVDVLTFIIFSSRLPPAVKRVRYISYLSSQIDATLLPNITFLVAGTLKKEIKLIVLIHLIRLPTPRANFSNLLANKIS